MNSELKRCIKLLIVSLWAPGASLSVRFQTRSQQRADSLIRGGNGGNSLLLQLGACKRLTLASNLDFASVMFALSGNSNGTV